jgi:hypothetical protein
MRLDSKTLQGAMNKDRTATIRSYASSALLTYYFYHVDGEGDAANIIAWLRALEKGGKQSELAQTHLLRGRSYADLEKDLVKATRKLGFDIDFTGDEEPPTQSAEAK